VSGFDIVIRGGLIFDGSGGTPYTADIGLAGGKIAAIGADSAAGDEEIQARGLHVTPGFVDVHTHYDGHVTWENRLEPSSAHGVTTVVIGNCGAVRQVGAGRSRAAAHARKSARAGNVGRRWRFLRTRAATSRGIAAPTSRAEVVLRQEAGYAGPRPVSGFGRATDSAR
jgi:N-acyl-D-aspartate/D-glutamate deacylase